MPQNHKTKRTSLRQTHNSKQQIKEPRKSNDFEALSVVYKFRSDIEVKLYVLISIEQVLCPLDIVLVYMNISEIQRD